MEGERGPQPRWRLKPLHVEGLPDLLTVPETGLLLGRDPDCDVVLVGDVYPIVSARHAKLMPEGDGLVLEDLASRNGTLVGGMPVELRPIGHGEVFQLGPAGPRFAVLSPRLGRPIGKGSSHPLARTAYVGREDSRMGTLEEVRGELGLQPAEALPLAPAPRPRARWRAVGVIGIMAILATAVLAGVRWYGLSAEQQRERELDADAFARSVDARLGESEGEIERQRTAWQDQRADFERARFAWETSRGELLVERDQLRARLGQLEEEGATTQALEELEERLELAQEELAKFDPIELQRTRVREIERVERAVVLIEARELLVEAVTGRPLYVSSKPKGARVSTFNLDEDGELFARESTGSGVCISKDGHILTNAHVVAGVAQVPSALINGDLVLEPKTELFVVFSGTDRRHPAKLLALRRSAREDLALLSIEPFEGLPHVDGIDLEIAIPPRGTEVYALGFPLGKRVLQVGDTVIASAFRGIVSRTVDPFVQVDAAVHPGASGGPVIDTQGRIVGLVTAMQSADPNASSSQIGYMLPIERARSIWPPAE